jgi:hypothetical protein
MRNLLTPRFYGREPSRRDVTGRINQAERFEATAGFESEVHTALNDGVQSSNSGGMVEGFFVNILGFLK